MVAGRLAEAFLAHVARAALQVFRDQVTECHHGGPSGCRRLGGRDHVGAGVRLDEDFRRLLARRFEVAFGDAAKRLAALLATDIELVSRGRSGKVRVLGCLSCDTCDSQSPAICHRTPACPFCRPALPTSRQSLP